MRQIFITLITLLFINQASAQGTFSKFYDYFSFHNGQPMNNGIHGDEIIQLKDGTFYMATGSRHYFDLYHLTDSGKIIEQYRYDEYKLGTFTEFIYDIEPLADKGIITLLQPHHNEDTGSLITKTDPNGDLIWKQPIISASPRCLGKIDNSEYFIMTKGWDDHFLYSMIDTSGQFVIKKNIKTVNGDINDCLCLDTMIYCTGSHNNHAAFFKYGVDSGDSLLYRSYSDLEGLVGTRMKSYDNHELLIGINNYVSGEGAVVLMKTNLDGDTLWTTNINPTENIVMHDMDVAPDHSTYITGTVDHYSDTGDAFIANVGNDGNVRWFQTYGGELEDCGHSLTATHDGGAAVTGFYQSDTAQHLWVLKVNGQGELSGQEFLTVNHHSLNVYPNPVENILTVEMPEEALGEVILTMTNMKGQVVRKETFISEGDYSFTVNDLSDGHYFLNLTVQDQGSWSKKILVK